MDFFQRHAQFSIGKGSHIISPFILLEFSFTDLGKGQDWVLTGPLRPRRSGLSAGRPRPGA